MDEGIRCRGKQLFGQVAVLAQQEPVVVLLCKAMIDGTERIEGRHDGERREADHTAGMVEHQPVADPRAAIVPRKREAFMSEGAHQRHERRACPSLGPARRHRVRPAGPVARQVGNDQRMVTRQGRGHLAPRDVRLGEAVKQQQRRTGAADDAGEAHTTRVEVERVEIRKERRRHGDPRQLLLAAVTKAASSCP